MKVNVKIKRLNDAAVIPQYAHEYDAGVDLVATEDVIVEPGETVKVPTGLAFELPPGYELQVRPRSGITLRTKLRVQIGTVDCTFRGEVGVIVDNIAQKEDEYHVIRKGDRIAQAVINKVEYAYFQEVAQLSETTRGTGGFGSSGVKS